MHILYTHKNTRGLLCWDCAADNWSFPQIHIVPDEQHLHSSVISPFYHGFLLPKTALCPVQGCVYILWGLHRGVREADCMYARTHYIHTVQVRCWSIAIFLPSLNATGLSHSFPYFSDPLLFFPRDQVNLSKQARLRSLEQTMWELTCGFWLRNDCTLSMNGGHQCRTEWIVDWGGLRWDKQWCVMCTWMCVWVANSKRSLILKIYKQLLVYPGMTVLYFS